MRLPIRPYMGRIITVTPNPALDKTLVVDEFVERGVLRVREVYQYPSGKGLNVSRAIMRLGGKSIATGFLGGPIGNWVEESLAAEGIECDFVFVRACTRTSTTVRCDAQGIEVHLVEPGEQIKHEEVEMLLEKLASLARENDIFVFCGSLPPGVMDDFYRRCIECVQSKCAIALLDASGKPLSVALRSLPFLVKPNEEELGETFGIKFQDDSQIVMAIEELLSCGIGCAIISQGERGAIGGCEDGIWRAVPPSVNVVNTIGSGDAMLGGIAYALWSGMSFEEMLQLSVAAGTANVLVDGPCYFDREAVFEIYGAVKLERIA
ncbi:MAG: 1-phosphofructokinase family hexose kinase [Armatimonadota bacterium]|nr:1-phosphofructokinase family hexose kinase [Armatimonadota bacterium]MCX7777634.1 1-phosphofructokinase family hexose kinase [Armatimonadota bacterium]MDW8025880.1 1-phosphofructokinase family hexose kinase [Armatimonadota bacterium]